MPNTNNFHEKRERQHNTHNRKAGVAKFKRNLGHRKGRRWANRIHKEWVEERDELDKFGSSTRRVGLNSRERAPSQMSPSPRQNTKL